MRSLARGHSRCYFKFLNFRQGNRKKKKKKSCPTFMRVSRKGREEELNKKKKRVKRKHRKRTEWIEEEVRKSLWEDVIMRAVNSKTGCERQRLSC